MKKPTRPTKSTRAVIRCRPEHKKAIEQAAKLERARLELEEMLKGKHVEFPKAKQSQRKM